MTPLVATVTNILSVATALSHVFLVVLIMSLVMYWRTKNSGKPAPAIVRFVSAYALELGLLVSVAAIVLSLFYSNVAGFAPCTLCWWQRVFLYPQAALFAVALYYRKQGADALKAILSLSLILSAIAGAIGLYQYYAQTFNPGLLATCVVGGVSCDKLYFVGLGYITIPLMALTSSLILIAVVVTKRVHA